MALSDLPATNAAGAALVVVGLVTTFGTMFKSGVLGFYWSEVPGIMVALGVAMACLLIGSRLFYTPLPSRPPLSTMAPEMVKTDREIAQEAEDEALASAEREKKNAERREHFAASGGSLVALLADPGIAKEARQMRRLYGRRACLDLLRRKAAELGLEAITLTEDDLPETF